MTRKTDEPAATDAFSALIQRAQDGDRDAEETLVTQNLPLVHAIMRRYGGRGVDTDDLRQLGLIGLLKAIRRFDLSYGVCFSTYAVPLIAGEIKRFLREDGIIKFSRTSKELAKHIQQLVQQRDDLRLNEIAAELGCSEEDVAVALDSGIPVASLDVTIADGDMTLGQMQASPDDREHWINHIYLEELMRSLDKRERLVLQLRYQCDLTQKETAARLHVSQVQISRLEKKILQKLRSRSEGSV